MRSQCVDADAFLGDANMTFLRHVLSNVPAANVHSENRFARHGRHQRAAAGSGPAPSTMAAYHVITESKTVLDTHTWSKLGYNLLVLQFMILLFWLFDIHVRKCV